MAEYSRLAKGHFTSTGSAQTIYIPFTPDSVQWWNYTEYATAGSADSVNVNGYWDVSMGQGFGLGEFYNSSGVLVTDIVTSNGISTFGLTGTNNAGLELQLGSQIQIVSIAKASPTVIVVSGLNHFSVGQVVILEGLFQSSTTGMPQMSNIPFVITAIGTSGGNQTITVTWNSNQSNYTALATSPTGAYVRQVLFPWNYLPGVNFISAITTGTTTTVTTTSNHNFVVGQEIAFRIPSAWGTTQLNSLPNNQIPGSPVYGYVTSLTSNTVFVCNINSTGYTAFNSNPTVAQTVGLTPPQVLAVGDVNSGGVAYSGGALYPSPSFPTYSGGISTINGPAISGSFVNNTAQGFTIGSGVGVTVSASTAAICGQSNDVVYWKAYLSDYAYN
jgi:hypothetical protein